MATQMDMCIVDGSFMEGGGQILRNAAALSCIMKKSIKVNKIRMGRDKPGLRPQHLTGLKMISDLCGGHLDGGVIGSTEVTLKPAHIACGEYLADPKTAGSVCLLLQAALPCVMFADGPTKLMLKGGTNADMAPQIDYFIMVLQPVLEQFGVKFDCDIVRRGYFPKGGGEVIVECAPIKRLRSVDLTTFGHVVKLTGRAFVAGSLPLKMAQIMADSARQVLQHAYPGETICMEVLKEPPHCAVGNASGIIITAETSTGCRLAGSALGKRGIAAENVGRDAANSLLASVTKDVCTDVHLQDQLILFMALAEGRSRIKCGHISQHTHTAIHTAELLTDAKFHIASSPDGTNIIECIGIGLENTNLKC